MADDLKKNPDESDPLSATAMFLRALDQESQAKQAEPLLKSEPGPPSAREQSDAAPSGVHGAEKTGGFTEIFGRSGSSASGPFAASSPPAEPVRPAQGPGEFTRIFVKDLPPPSSKPVARNIEEHPEAVPSPQVRPKGFSTPGSSDAASAETSFTQIFRPTPRSTAESTQASEPTRSEPPRESTAAFPGGRSSESNPAKYDPSITSLIESLSSPGSANSQRAPEPAPYRADPLGSYQPIAKPAQPSQFDAGGVTSFIQRLSDPPPQPKVAPAPVHEPAAGQGEFTRIISSSRIDANVAPVGSPQAPAAPAPAPAPEIAFTRPPAPQVQPIQIATPPVQVVMPQAHVAMPQAHAAAPAVAAPKVPAPHLPPTPALPAAPAQKGKLESFVPMLLVVNTFLLVVILVVMIFLIKAR